MASLVASYLLTHMQVNTVLGWFSPGVKSDGEVHVRLISCWDLFAPFHMTSRTGVNMLDLRNSYSCWVDKDKGITGSELIANAQLLTMAGSSAMVTALISAAYYLMLNPEKQQKLHHEIRSSCTHESDISVLSTSKLPYLVAVLNEAMRMHPPLPAGNHRFVPAGGAIIDGRFVAGGTDVTVHQWAAYHSGANFKNPDMFVPKRWLDDPAYESDCDDVFQPFHVGPRN